MSNKRANGEGSIYKKKSGLWCGQVVLPTGKRRTLYGKTRRAVSQKIAEIRSDPTNVPSPGHTTLGQYLDRWFKTASTSLAP